MYESESWVEEDEILIEAILCFHRTWILSVFTNHCTCVNIEEPIEDVWVSLVNYDMNQMIEDNAWLEWIKFNSLEVIV